MIPLQDFSINELTKQFVVLSSQELLILTFVIFVLGIYIGWSFTYAYLGKYKTFCENSVPGTFQEWNDERKKYV